MKQGPENSDGPPAGARVQAAFSGSAATQGAYCPCRPQAAAAPWPAVLNAAWERVRAAFFLPKMLAADMKEINNKIGKLQNEAIKAIRGMIGS